MSPTSNTKDSVVDASKRTEKINPQRPWYKESEQSRQGKGSYSGDSDRELRLPSPRQAEKAINASLSLEPPPDPRYQGLEGSSSSSSGAAHPSAKRSHSGTTVVSGSKKSGESAKTLVDPVETRRLPASPSPAQTGYMMGRYAKSPPGEDAYTAHKPNWDQFYGHLERNQE